MPGISYFDKLFAASVAVLAGIYLIRCVLGAGLYLLGSAPGRLGSGCRRLAGRITPRLVRRAASTLVGAVVLGSGVTVAAEAAPTPVAPGGQHSTVDLPELERGPLAQGSHKSERNKPQRDTAVADDPVIDLGQSPNVSPATVVVKSGDSLWQIARRNLQTTTPKQRASDSAIDAEWRRLYDANRRSVGADPDVIAPGLRLVTQGTGATK